MSIPSTGRKAVFYFTLCPAQRVSVDQNASTRERNANISCRLVALVLPISSKSTRELGRIGENFCSAKLCSQVLEANCFRIRKVTFNDSVDQTCASLAYPTTRNFLFKTWCHVYGKRSVHCNELTAREKLSVSVLHSVFGITIGKVNLYSLHVTPICN